MRQIDCGIRGFCGAVADISACVSGLYVGDRGSDVSDRFVFWLVPDHFAEDEPEQPGKNFYWSDLYLHRACPVPYRSKCRLYAGRNRGLGGRLASLPYRWCIVPIGMVIGYFIVMAEPAVHVLTHQVEEMHRVRFRQRQ